jgi:ABC-type amino acid transport substrate-binding protein
MRTLINERVQFMKKLLLFVAVCLIYGVAHSEELTVGIKEAEPFAYKSDEGWTGVSVDLLNEISAREGFTYKLVEYESVPQLIEETSQGNVDMSIAALSLTPDREKLVDFSHTYFSTSLGILAQNKVSGWEYALWILGKVTIVLIGLIASMYAIGWVISRVDKGGDIDGAHEGAWWALVTFSTTGYGDEVPVTNGGKVVASGWIIASMFLASIFTAYMSSAMTVQKLTDETTTLADLERVNVNVVEGTTAHLKLAELGIEYDAVPSLNVAMDNFKSGKTDVVVYDKAILDYASKDIDDVDVHPINNSDEYYAIALPPGSLLSEKVNLGILKILSTSKWKAIKATYFGAE